MENDKNLLTECGFLKIFINRLCKEYENILLEQNERYLNHIKNEVESINEKLLNK